MQWNDHSRLVGQHAFLGASKYHWLNYDTQRLVDAFMSCQAKEKGTRLHAFAAECINLKQKLPKSKKTLNAYVNDAIGFRMDPEQVLFYSENCFGTTDAIAFNDKDNFLRIRNVRFLPSNEKHCHHTHKPLQKLNFRQQKKEGLLNATEEEHTGRSGCGFGPACNKSGSTGTVHDKPDHATGGKKAARRDGFQCRNNALPEAGYYESGP